MGDINIQCILYILYIDSYMTTWVCIWGLQRVSNIFMVWNSSLQKHPEEGFCNRGNICSRGEMKPNLEYLPSVSQFLLQSSCLQLSLILPWGRVDAECGVQSPRESHTTLSFICVSCTDAYLPVLSLTEDTSKTWLLNIRDKKPEKRLRIFLDTVFFNGRMSRKCLLLVCVGEDHVFHCVMGSLHALHQKICTLL